MTAILHSMDAAPLQIHSFQHEMPEIKGTNAKSIENAEPSNTKSQTHETPNIENNITVTPDIPTSEMGIEHNTDIVSGESKTNDIPLSTKSFASPTVTKTGVFLCDSNGKYIDTRKLFHPTQEFSYFRCPKIEFVNTILNDVENQKSGHPQVTHCRFKVLYVRTCIKHIFIISKDSKR